MLIDIAYEYEISAILTDSIPAWIPKQCLHWRGSYGVGKEGAMVCLVTRSRHASTHFCCYFTYFVHVTFTTLQRNGPFFQICCKLQYKINFFGLSWSLVPLWQVSACLVWYSDHIWVIFWANMNKSAISSKWAYPKISGMSIFQK